MENRTRDQLAAAVSACLLERGLEATTYRSVAEHAGCSRALVQYYYPQKSAFVEGFLTRMGDETVAALERAGIPGEDLLAGLYPFLQLHFSLLASDRLRPLATDVLARRDITSQVMRADQRWTLLARHAPSLTQAQARYRYGMVVGGSYDLLYQQLLVGGAVDVRGIVDNLFDVLSQMADGSLSRSEGLDDAALVRMVGQVFDAMSEDVGH